MVADAFSVLPKVALARDSRAFRPKLHPIPLCFHTLIHFSSLFARTGRITVGSSKILLQLYIQTYVPTLLSSSDRFQLEPRRPQVESFFKTIAKIPAAAAGMARRI